MYQACPKSIEIKKDEFADQSVLMLNKEFSKASKWDEVETTECSTRIAELVTKIWPIPAAA